MRQHQSKTNLRNEFLCYNPTFSNGLGLVRINNKEGFIDKTGTIRINTRYHFPHRMYNPTGNVILDFDCDGRGIIWGIIDSSENYTVKPQHLRRIDQFFDNIYMFTTLEGKRGVFNTKGQVIIPPTHDIVSGFNEGLCDYRYKDKWGFIDRDYNIVIKPEFEKVYGFSTGFSGVKSGGKWGFIDKSGNWIIHPQYDYIHSDFDDISRDYAAVISETHAYIIDRCGDVILIGPDKIFLRIDGEFIITEKNGKEGVIDLAGKSVLPNVYDYIFYFDSIFHASKADGRIKFFKPNGSPIIPVDLNLADPGQNNESVPFLEGCNFSEGLCSLKFKNGKWGYINKSGETVIEPRFFYALNFSEGFASVLIEKGGSIYHAYINQSADIIWETVFMFKW